VIAWLMSPHTPAERAAKVKAARDRIAKAEAQRRADKRDRQLAKAAKLRKKGHRDG